MFPESPVCSLYDDTKRNGFWVTGGEPGVIEVLKVWKWPIVHRSKFWPIYIHSIHLYMNDKLNYYQTGGKSRIKGNLCFSCTLIIAIILHYILYYILLLWCIVIVNLCIIVISSWYLMIIWCTNVKRIENQFLVIMRYINHNYYYYYYYNTKTRKQKLCYILSLSLDR